MSGPVYELAEMERQTLALASDLPALLREASVDAASVWLRRPGLERIVVVGSGDSLNAALACGPAFSAGCGAEYWAGSGSDYLRRPITRGTSPSRTAVIGVSASGNNPSAVAAVEAARARGCLTVAVTSTADSPLAAAAATVVTVGLGLMGPSPGIRTYQASLAAMLCLAENLSAGDGSTMPELANVALADRLAQAVRRSVTLAHAEIPALADSLAVAPLVLVVGSGPALGTARHVAAKITETAALPAMGVDSEDWWHMHRFGHGRSHPVLFVATPRAARDDVLSIAKRTADRRSVVVVGAEDDWEARSCGSGFVPVASSIPVIFRPLVDHVFAGPLAVALADRRGMRPFMNP